MTKLIGIVLAALLVGGCYGRIDDGQNRQIDSKAFGLDSTRPALIVFGAGWCKPCLSEIPALNRAQSELKDIQIVNFLVEGPQKGIAVTPADKALYQSPKGEKPQFSLSMDPSWKLFDALQPQAGRTLPTMVFVTWDQKVARIVQRSMEYEAELLPALRALAAGKPLEQPEDRPVEQPEEQNPVDEGTQQVLAFADWVVMPGNEPTTDRYRNLKAGWTRGLEDFAFLEDDFPFNKAKMTALVYADGNSKPQKAVWDAFHTGCRLTVFTRADGSYERSEGICR